MRTFTWSILGVVGLMTTALAQTPPPRSPQENLDLVLRGWEKAMTDLKSFSVVVDRTTIDKALQTKDDFRGYAIYSRGLKDQPSRARLEMAKVSNPKLYEKYICTGTFLYEYVPANTLVRIHNMPDNKPGGPQQESFLSFLFGMGADQAKARYQMEYKGSDAHYHYIRILPKLPQDKGDFAEARLSLLRTNNLPAQMWYLHANKNEITWNFTKAQVDAQIDLKYFEPDMKGWQVQRVQPPTPANVAPTVRTKPQ